MRKNILIMFVIGLLAITIGYTYSAFKNTIKGTITATTNNWKFSVNVPSGVKEKDYYKIFLSNSSGAFDISLSTTGSNKDVDYSIEFSEIDNVNLYTDSSYSNKINNNIYEGTINKNKSTTVTIYYKSNSTINDYVCIKTKGTVKVGTTFYQYIAKQDNNDVDTNINFASASSSTNGDGINIVNGTKNNIYPIYYYRGNVTNNNVIFAGFCWLIVRTTETGGVKLVYNGVPSSGKCNNTGLSSFLPNYSYFGAGNNSPVYVGYMHGLTTYTSSQLSAYQTHLSDMSVIGSSNTETETIGTKTFNIAGRHTQNAKSSIVKLYIDSWYQDNILDTEYENMLEDTVWCNDRSISMGTYSLANMISGSVSYFVYQAAERTGSSPYMPSLTCSRDIDKFTVSSLNGNGDLEYPIGMLTSDELTYAGNGNYAYSTSTYLSSGKYWWTLSPSRYSGGAYVFEYYPSGKITQVYTKNTSDSIGVRPAISIKNNVLIDESILSDSTAGSANNPIVIE